MKKERAKRMTATLLTVLMLFSLAACKGNTDTPPANSQTPDPGVETTAPTEPAFEVHETDEDIYFAALGDFYDAYQLAMEADTVSERHALLAVAEAKVLESGVGAPLYGPTAGYTFTRLVTKSGGYAPWRGSMTDYAQYVITNEIISSEDNAYIQQLWTDCLGTGTYIEKAKAYLTEKGYTFADTYTGTFTDSATTWDIYAASTSTDAGLIAPTYDYLFAYNAEGELVPRLATGYEIGDDGRTYTIHIREGLTWVDSQGRKVADLTADDWLASSQHLLDLGGGYSLRTYVVGAAEYASGESTDFSTVGIKALDDYTLQYTLIEPTTYFHTMFQSSTFSPLCRSYFLSQGGAFGISEYAEAAASPSYSYGTDQNHIAYCGQFLCTNVTERNSVTYVLNESYWNAENATLKAIKLVYDDGSDTNRAYENFMNGITVSMYLKTAYMETAKANGDFEKYAGITDTGRASFLFWFNLNRQTYANVADGAAPSRKTDIEKEVSRAALQNEHFRLAMSHSIDRATYIAQNIGEDLKTVSIRNTLTPGTYVSLEEDATIEINGVPTTFPAGTWYGEIVQAQLDADDFHVTVWDGENKTSDGWDGWYNPEQAAEEMAIAVQELASIGYEVSADAPIVIDFPYSDFSEIGQNQAFVLKTCIEDATGGLVRFDLIPLNNSSESSNVAVNTNSGAEHNCDMGGLGAIGSDYGDPQCYTEALLPYGDGYLTPHLGLW